MLLSACLQIILSMPLQLDVIDAVACLFQSLARLNNHNNDPSRIEFLITHPFLSQLFGSLFGSNGISPLSADGLMCVYRALGSLTMRSQSDTFMQVSLD